MCNYKPFCLDLLLINFFFDFLPVTCFVLSHIRPYIILKPEPMRQLKITSSITGRDVCLDKYFREIDKVALITPNEEVQLAERIKKGEKAALDRLTKANLRFVVSVAKKYQGQGLPLHDLINEGNIGLIEAASRFDPTRGFRFISFAVWYIRQSIIKALADYARIIKLPFNKLQLGGRIYKAYCTLEQQLERTPSDEELAEATDINPEEIFRSLQYKNQHLSLETPLGDDDDAGCLLDILENTDKDETVTELYHSASLKTELNRLLAVLSDREREVLCNFFGIGLIHPMSLDDIAARMYLTTERVRQIKDKALEKLRAKGNPEILRCYLAA
jgi:RNA polymerase primary sigma factor